MSLQPGPPVEPESAAVPRLDDPRPRAHVAQGPDAHPSSPPELLAEGARALLPASGELSRRCQNPGRGRPLTGRAGQPFCSGRCRAALSRQRQAEARAARDRAVLAHVEAIRRLVGDRGPAGR